MLHFAALAQIKTTPRFDALFPTGWAMVTLPDGATITASALREKTIEGTYLMHRKDAKTRYAQVGFIAVGQWFFTEHVANLAPNDIRRFAAVSHVVKTKKKDVWLETTMMSMPEYYALNASTSIKRNTPLQ